MISAEYVHVRSTTYMYVYMYVYIIHVHVHVHVNIHTCIYAFVLTVRSLQWKISIEITAFRLDRFTVMYMYM